MRKIYLILFLPFILQGQYHKRDINSSDKLDRLIKKFDDLIGIPKKKKTLDENYNYENWFYPELKTEPQVTLNETIHVIENYEEDQT